MTNTRSLPLPDQYDPLAVVQVRRVPYNKIAPEAHSYARCNGLTAAAADRVRVGLLAIDCQLTFCHPDFELYVGGRSGTGAVDDMRRLVEFIYRNLALITRIHCTMDTHLTGQIFFDIFFVDANGRHPAPLVSDLSLESLQRRDWRANPAAAAMLGMETEALQKHILHYAAQLAAAGKYSLTIWPYHAMLGGLGHALVPGLEEACFFHAQARYSQTSLDLKGSNPLTENYSVLRPEVLDSWDRVIAHKNTQLIDTLLSYDRLIIAGEAKSHCVAWTVDDLLNEVRARNPEHANRVYLLEDCTSPVVVPGVVDYSDQADAAYARFAAAGVHIVKSTDEIDWNAI